MLRRWVWSRNIKNRCSIYIYDISSLRVKPIYRSTFKHTLHYTPILKTKLSSKQKQPTYSCTIPTCLAVWATYTFGAKSTIKRNLFVNIPIHIQQDATLHSLLYLETALHISGGTPPIIRSAYSCIYSIWYLSHRYCYLPLSWKSWNAWIVFYTEFKFRLVTFYAGKTTILVQNLTAWTYLVLST